MYWGGIWLQSCFALFDEHRVAVSKCKTDTIFKLAKNRQEAHKANSNRCKFALQQEEGGGWRRKTTPRLSPTDLNVTVTTKTPPKWYPPKWQYPRGPRKDHHQPRVAILRRDTIWNPLEWALAWVAVSNIIIVTSAASDEFLWHRPCTLHYWAIRVNILAACDTLKSCAHSNQPHLYTNKETWEIDWLASSQRHPVS